MKFFIESNPFLPLKEWLNKRIHRHGRQFTSKELIQRATGQTLSAEPFLKSLRHKMQEVYGFSE